MPKLSQELTEETPIEKPTPVANQNGNSKSRETYSNLLAVKRPETMPSKIARASVEKAVSSQTGTFSTLESLN